MGSEGISAKPLFEVIMEPAQTLNVLFISSACAHTHTSVHTPPTEKRVFKQGASLGLPAAAHHLLRSKIIHTEG